MSKFSSLQPEKQLYRMMPYCSKQLDNGRWGIFANDELIATVGCYDTCQKMIQVLESRFSNYKDLGFRRNIMFCQYFAALKLRVS